jgi:hypothetical protein
MNIGDLEVAERVRPGVTLVFGEEQFHRAAFDGYKGRESGLESMHGRFAGSRSLIPGHGSRRILNAQYRDYFLFHLGSIATVTHSSSICQGAVPPGTQAQHQTADERMATRPG